jgi:Ca2+-binding EF-hand superfamily protein
MKRMTIAVAASILSVPGFAVAQDSATSAESQSRQGIPSTPHQEEAMKEIKSNALGKLDTDRDGLVSREEAQAKPGLSDKWSSLDQNADGQLDAEELAKVESKSHTGHDTASATATRSTEDMPSTPHQKEVVGNDLLGELDEDGDGMISQEEAEAEAQLSDNWDRLDRNRDGQLDSRELDRRDQ